MNLVIGPLLLQHDGRLVRSHAEQQPVGLLGKVRPLGPGDNDTAVHPVPKGRNGKPQRTGPERVGDAWALLGTDR